MSDHGKKSRADPDVMRPNIARLNAYWQRIGGGATPERSSVDPAEITDLLPFLMLVEFTQAPFRVRYRLTGTFVDQQTGLNLTGRYLDEFSHGDGRDTVQQLIDGYRLCAETGRPHHGVYEWPTLHGYPRQIGFGLFPLLVGGVVTQALSIEDYSDITPETHLANWVAPVR